MAFGRWRTPLQQLQSAIEPRQERRRREHADASRGQLDARGSPSTVAQMSATVDALRA